MKVKNDTKILFFDIETSLMKTYTFYIGNKVSIQPSQVIEDMKIICICYKWADEKEIHSLEWNMKKKDDSQMLKKFRKIVDQADLVMAHNGDHFDIRRINARLALNGLDPLPGYVSTDTLKQFRKHFGFHSHRLDAVAKMLGFDGKDKMSMQDWIDIDNGDEKALRKMVKYCKKDVKLLQDVYNKLKPYLVPTMKEIKARTKVDDGRPKKCPHCEGKSIIKYGIYKHKGQNIQKYLCNSCYSVFKKGGK